MSFASRRVCTALIVGFLVLVAPSAHAITIVLDGPTAPITTASATGGSSRAVRPRRRHPTAPAMPGGKPSPLP